MNKLDKIVNIIRIIFTVLYVIALIILFVAVALLWIDWISFIISLLSCTVELILIWALNNLINRVIHLENLLKQNNVRSGSGEVRLTSYPTKTSGTTKGDLSAKDLELLKEHFPEEYDELMKKMNNTEN